MNMLYSVDFLTAYGNKNISVAAQDITSMDNYEVDVLTTSSFKGSYAPTKGSLFGALSRVGVDVRTLARNPYIDLRETSGVWLSEPISSRDCVCSRIGCIEFEYKKGIFGGYSLDEMRLLGSVKSYFYMLDIAVASGVKMDTVALPLLGTGTQRISQNLIITPLINECLKFLKRNESVKRILFVEKNQEKAMAFVNAIKNSYSLFRESLPNHQKENEKRVPMAFISYTTPNRNIADNLCFKLESKGIKVWYAPRNVDGPYAASIAEAIERSTYFIVILSADSMLSEHMLNEIDLAFKRLPKYIKFKPLRIDTTDLTPSFNYYLSRQHWMDAHIPPLEARLDEFVSTLVDDISVLETDATTEMSFDSDPNCVTGGCREFDADENCYSCIESLFDDEDVLNKDKWENRSGEFDADERCRTCALPENKNPHRFDDMKMEFDAEGIWLDDGVKAPIMTEPTTSDSAMKDFSDYHNESSKAYCVACGMSLDPGGAFCPFCGERVHKEKENVKISQVQFSAVVPKRFVKGEYSMIDISVYEEAYREIVDRIIENADSEVKEVIASTKRVKDNTEIRMVLYSPDIDLPDCEETQEWIGKYLVYSFPVHIPSNYAKKQALFIASVYFDDVIATKLKFVVNCTTVKDQKLELLREDVLSAFISYASQDRSRVATIIQGMKKVRPDMDIFFDIESLRSGEGWENAIRREIEKRDVLYLCWSKFARESKWVEIEWKYALDNKGIDSIEPVPLVSPAECPPPKELSAKHFNDRALLYN